MLDLHKGKFEVEEKSEESKDKEEIFEIAAARPIET